MKFHVTCFYSLIYFNYIKNKRLRLCSIHYARWYRKHHKARIIPTKRNYYDRNRERINKQIKEWSRKNDYYKTRKRDTSEEAKEINAIRWKTIGKFKHLKENGKCEDCDATKNLEFHHLEPYAYDNFRILCKRCHMRVHRKVLIEMDDNKGVKE